MSINHIQLTDFIVAEWYKDALLPLAKGPAPATPSAAVAPLTPQSAPAAVPPPPASTPAPSNQAPATSPPPVPPQAAPQAPASPPAASQAPPATSHATAPAAVPTPRVPPVTPHTPTSATDPAPAAASSPAPYKFLGNNRRHITLLVHSPGSGFMPDNQLTFLTKILEACRMTLADVAIVNDATAPVTITALRQQLQPKTVLLFGVDPTAIRLPINFPTFKQLSYDDCTYLSSPALDQLVPDTGDNRDSKLLKSKLWVCLKTLFDV
jgi:hypothetical protein